MLESGKFLKLMKEAPGLLDSHFDAKDAEILFAKVISHRCRLPRFVLQILCYLRLITCGRPPPSNIVAHYSADTSGEETSGEAYHLRPVRRLAHGRVFL